MGSIYETKDSARKAARIAKLIAENEKYTLDDFGGKPSIMVSKYEKPKAYPRKERPRVFVTSEMLPRIRETLADPIYSSLAKNFLDSANTEYYTHSIRCGAKEHNAAMLELPKEYTEGGPHPFDGRFLSTEITGKSYNWDGKVIGIIEAKALMYLITGDEIYGREAILYIKNAMQTVRFTPELFGDTFRAYSYMMLVTAEIYDWCNGLLTATDKEQLISGCEHILCALDPTNGVVNMTIGFPPTRLSGVSGHGVSVMLPRDYMAMSAAIYDERPDWWELCAGRYYQEFVEPANVAFRGGFVSQGTSLYCFNKFHTYLSSAWVVKCATGEMPFDPNMKNVMSSILGHFLPNGLMFQTGDGARTDRGVERISAYACMILSAGLFPDSAVSANAKYHSKDFTDNEYFINEISESMTLIMMANAATPAEDRFAANPMAVYNPYPFGQLVSHNSWDENGCASLMKIGEFTSANHDHLDSGTFQLYYKSLLLTSNGTYAKYGSNHHLFYHQATVAQNGLLIYNPKRHNPNADPKGRDWGERMSFWYSGGQRHLAEAATMEKWLGGEYELGRVTGYACDYFEGEKTPTYAYIAGDITKAYYEDTVDHVERRMLTVYTEDEKCPMLFFTYDRVTSAEDSFKKTYLLHTSSEPKISGNTVTFAKHGARLTCTMLKGAESVESIGGAGRAYMINGVNCDGEIGGKWNGDNADLLWGRVEFSVSSSRECEFLAAMSASDDGEYSHVARGYENSSVATAELHGVCAAFVRCAKRRYDVLTFETSGEVDTFYVSGVASGDWQVEVDGKAVSIVHANEESGFLTFLASGKIITLTPIPV